ncbi:2-C-methyl-D-erythritol 4-phosphate cytidylyltransferase [Aestuariirhabdus sp. Z084]|uniref:2-C-methyl-D-erythritol 4-phosphate cytidylyltransferase n=1 Tax=Aestuariirhabdus haliotis TaxID=2918751 RepID=UPI00201B42F6|nr:2-C-methyl-D-erythritol 4-phosphate cytidylyltransferase [Aestuariirhabdus haliotis]MCL6416362.1 2-C-methyl-D-erythritol 4-phosphate cytidylyltransferase [Aestuariirhabdus haliotis]MCL6420351.1 2-C-methyl-D-erythritol 4-phosphate cytidylyltransferase [Aestuariirhabdus haliotis]
MTNTPSADEQSSRCYAIVPAAGIGKRMGADRPKQYLELDGKTVIEHTLDRLRNFSPIEQVVVVLAPGDPYQAAIPGLQEPDVIRCDGGEERCHSVFNGLQRLHKHARDRDWILVHDVARPCIRRQDLQRLWDCLQSHEVGGLLGVPVRDTMKRTNVSGDIVATVDREQLWHAYTPQMFRYGLLRQALAYVLERDELVTDEAAAIEAFGYHPRMIEGASDNIKITRPEDLTLAEFYLARQQVAQ